MDILRSGDRSILIVFSFFFLLLKNPVAKPTFQAGWYFSTGFPQKEFGDNLSEIPSGWGLEFNADIPSTILTIGGSFHRLRYGFQDGSLIISKIPVNFEEENTILQWHFVFKMRSMYGSIRPYVEGLVGFNYFSTQTSLTDPVTGHGLVRANKIDHLAWSYGGGFGFLLKIYQLKANGLGEMIFLDVKTRFIRGETAQYSSTVDEPVLSEEYPPQQIFRSETDVLNVQVGLVITF
jgi:hypothetical protein